MSEPRGAKNGVSLDTRATPKRRGALARPRRRRAAKDVTLRALEFAHKSLRRKLGAGGSLIADHRLARLGNGQHVVYLQHWHLGMPVFDSMVLVVCSPKGRPTRLTATLVDARGTPSSRVSLSAVAALEKALAHVDESESEQPAEVTARFPLACEPTALKHPGCVGIVPCHLSWFHHGAQLQPGWRLFLTSSASGPFEAIVGASGRARGRILYCQSTHACVAGSGSVYWPNPSSPATVLPMPLLEAAYELPASGVAGFPWDWVDGNTTSGQNVVAASGFHGTPVFGTQVNGQLRFADADAAQTGVLNAFFWCNVAHDFFYLLGFREVDGNYQTVDKLTKGRPGDPMTVSVFSTPSTNFGNVQAVQDGLPPDMLLAQHPTTGRQAALDAEVVLHEYTHAVTERLAAGRLSWNVAAKPQGRAMAEGLSDFFALSILEHLGAPTSPRRAFGVWVANDAVHGLRRVPYDAQFAATFADLGGFKDEHDAGQVWAMTLFRSAEALGQLVGDAERGVRMTWQLVLDSLKVLAAGHSGPSFLDARDALLSAANPPPKKPEFSGLSAPVLAQSIRAVFSRMGMGPGATSKGAAFKGVQADFS